MNRTFEDVLVEQCAPTLAGIKPASLFRFQADSLETIRLHTAEWDQRLRSFGIRVHLLKECPGTLAGMIYLYREKWLTQLVAEKERRAFLEQHGYYAERLPEMLEQLSQRFCLEQEYPHEIGIFLGYPLQDVVGFIENKARNYTCCGYWKCYGDPAAAQNCFERYRICTRIYKKRYASGTPIVQLVAAA